MDRKAERVEKVSPTDEETVSSTLTNAVNQGAECHEETQEICRVIMETAADENKLEETKCEGEQTAESTDDDDDRHSTIIIIEECFEDAPEEVEEVQSGRCQRVRQLVSQLPWWGKQLLFYASFVPYTILLLLLAYFGILKG